MKVRPNTVVSFTYTLSDFESNIIESTEEPILYLHGGYDDILPKIEAALEGATVGSQILLHLEPDEAFGDYEPDLVQMEDLKTLPQNVTVGMVLRPDDVGDHVESDNDVPFFTVTDIADGQAVLDGNHPLAGMAMRLKLQVVGVRSATNEEIAEQHANYDEEDNLMDERAFAKQSGYYRSYHIH